MLFENEVMTATFEAAEDVTLLRLCRPDFMTIMMRYLTGLLFCCAFIALFSRTVPYLAVLLRYPELAERLAAAGHEIFESAAVSPTSRRRDEVLIRVPRSTYEPGCFV